MRLPKQDTLAPVEGFPKRLRACRVSTYMRASDAARKLEMPYSTLKMIEEGNRLASTDLIDRMAVLFGVSSGYLRNAIVGNDVDGRADRARRGIEKAKSVTPTSRASVARRLRFHRLKSGFKTANDAAVKFVWPVSTYSAHDAGRRSIPLERIVVYSIAYNVSPEILLSDDKRFTEPKFRYEDIKDRRERSPNGAFDSSFSYGFHACKQKGRWDWIEIGRVSRPFVRLPILTFRNGSFRLLEHPLLLPLVPSMAEAGADDGETYAIVVNAGSVSGTSTISIMRGPWAVDDDRVRSSRRLVCDGSIIRPPTDGEQVLHDDPVRYPGTPSGPVDLGTQILFVDILSA